VSETDFERRRFERQMAERQERIEKARGPFQDLFRFAHLNIPSWSSGGRPVRAFERVRAGFMAVREWRNANQQNMQTDELEMLAVRLCADQFAREIEDTASGAGQDPATIAWVVAGLRCPSRPFCTGCSRCFTITSPHRPNEGSLA
jgi:hypothetical protein